ncbi:cyclodeaminase/cyclohydrolase family protein [Microbacterium lacusdiani]
MMLASAAALVAMVASYAEESGVERRARALAQAALDRADADAAASAAFGTALRAGDDRARDEAALAAARSSAALAALARDAIGDLERIARRVEPTLLADVVSAAAALRAALSCARANLRSDLGALSRHGGSGALRRTHPDLWTAASACDDVIARLDDLTRRIDTRAAGAD